MGLEDIGVKVEGGYGKALLSEIALLLERLIETGEVGVIDLRALPMGPLDYQTIKEALGEGEVKAEVRALGPTEVYETRYPGVWWVTHRNAENEVVAERIEITFSPEILKSPKEDVKAGLNALKLR